MEAVVVDIELRYFDSCPNWKIADTRLREAMSALGLSEPISHTEVDTVAQAERLGFVGSPTILIDGTDPFLTDADTAPGLACRIYDTEDGRPARDQIQRALAAAADAALSPSTDDIVAALTDAAGSLDVDDQHLVVVLYRTLAEGEPVSVERLAEVAHRPAADIAEKLESWPGAIFRDDGGAVVGFGGLTVVEMPSHQMQIGDVVLYAWCAWDPLFIIPILNKAAEVTSVDPVSGDEITLTVTPDGITHLDPAATVVSFIRPDQRFDDSVIASFCHHVHYLVGPESARQWTQQRTDAFYVTAAEAFEIGRRWNRNHFPDIPGLANTQPGE